MSEKTFKIKLHHPLTEDVLEEQLLADLTFEQLLSRLYKTGFLERKTADYVFIIHGRTCAMNKTLASYIHPETADAVDVEISGMLTIMT